MPKSSYQTYASETPISAFRSDFLYREAMCAALARQHPELAPIGAEAREIVAAIDGRRAALEHAEDDLIRARALENVEKLGVADAYAKLRGVVSVYDAKNTIAFLPERPSSLARQSAKDVRSRVAAAITSLRELPDGESRYAELVGALEGALADFAAADEAEDSVRAQLKAARLGLTLYRGELAAVRDRQLGTIQAILEERGRAALFTLPWRKRSPEASEGVGDAEAAPLKPASA